MSPWKSPLLLLGILAIITAGAALFAPFFLDWDAYRPTIESYGRQLTGREVRIGGRIDAQLFPWPTLTLRDVRVANPAGAIHPDLLVAPVLTIELALPPLLSGHLEMTEVRIARPTVALERLTGNEGTWNPSPTGRFSRRSGRGACPSRQFASMAAPPFLPTASAAASPRWRSA